MTAVAGMGPPPSENRRRRNKDTFEGYESAVDGGVEVRGPELPGVERYSELTVQWYETWRRSPQAGVFVATDWQRLHMLAPLVEEYHQAPSTKLLSEIRLNESLLGATHADRLRARIKVEAPKRSSSAPPAGVADLTSRRRRLTDAS